MEAEWSQSRVLPSAELAYETGLSAGSIAMLAHGHQNRSPHPELHPPTLGATSGQPHHADVLQLPGRDFSKAGLAVYELNQLQDIGLIRFEPVSKMSSNSFPSESFLVHHFGTTVQVEFSPLMPKPLNPPLRYFLIGLVMLAKAGEELAVISDAEPQPGFLDYVVNNWREMGFRLQVPPAQAEQQG